MARALTKAGRYQIVSELGRGSMGVVYQGFDPVIGRTVAIKTMLVEGLAPAEFEEFKARFQREAQAAGVLSHPNIVTVYDFGEDTGVLYLAMEYLEGKSLQKLVEEQNILPVETIIPMYEQVCNALDHAHANRIVHRDIKPANIMILESGLVKVTDFGIAKMLSMGMTQAGQILGTPNYMSPEQVKGRPVDGRSDIFSLGVILYELVTGEKPFGGQNITTVIYKIINENPIPPRELDATIHPGLSYVISKALAKSPDERYQTCRELSQDLKNFKNMGGATAPSETVVIKVPPVQAAPAPAAAPPRPRPLTPATPPVAAPKVEERPPVRPMSVQVVHPARREESGTSPVLWGILILLIAGALGGGYYYFFMRSQGGTNLAGNNPPAVTFMRPEGGGNPAGSNPPPAANPSPATSAPASPAAAAPQPSETRAGAAESAAEKPRVTLAGSPRTAGPKVGQLLITSNIAGAKISIDDRSDPDWVAPKTISDLTAGVHTIAVSKEGYSTWRQSVSVEGGHTKELTAELHVPTGMYIIKTEPSGIEVLIDGKSYGMSPVEATLTAGDHEYVIEWPGAPPGRGTFNLKEGDVKGITARLSGGAAVPTGIVEVHTIPPGAVVFADGKAIPGKTPISFRLPTGPHTLTLTISGFQTVRKEINVTAGGSQPVNERLSPISPQ